MSFCERFEFVEDGVKERRCESDEQNEWQRDQPDPDKVAARRDADDPVEEKQDGSAKEQREAHAFGQVAKPAQPALNADSVMAADRVADDIQRQVCQGRDDHIRSEEEQSLHPTAAQQALSPGCQEKKNAQVE